MTNTQKIHIIFTCSLLIIIGYLFCDRLYLQDDNEHLNTLLNQKHKEEQKTQTQTEERTEEQKKEMMKQFFQNKNEEMQKQYIVTSEI